MDRTFERDLARLGEETETLLGVLLSALPRPHEPERPERLIAAMRYSALGGGKRLRPFLVVASSVLFGGGRLNALRAGAALECVHCYSLVHDDLPAMDDDDMRRGRPTTHVAFDEAGAILAGDALLTYAFEILTDPDTDPDPALRLALVTGLARAAGLAGMVGGQMLDLVAEKAQVPTERDVSTLQAMKTGALITYACEAGARLGRASESDRAALIAYGRALGEAFQIADDLLDVEGDAAETGKATAKDAARGKATLITLLGVEGAKERLARRVAEAETALARFGPKADPLRRAARFVASRRR